MFVKDVQLMEEKHLNLALYLLESKRIKIIVRNESLVNRIN